MTLYEKRWGLPGFGKGPKAPEHKTSPFVRELQLLAQTPGICDNFLPTIESFSPNRRDAQEVIKLLDWGRRYHRSDLGSAFHEGRMRDQRGKLMEVGVYVPKVMNSEGGKRSITIPIGSDLIKAKLLGIVGARYVGDGLRVMFDGVVVPKGFEVHPHTALIVGIDSHSGQMHFHPDFLPDSQKIVTVDDVVPPFRTTRQPDES